MERTRLTNDTYRGFLLRKGLWFALNSMNGSWERWEHRRKSGLTDDELRKAITYEFQYEGGLTTEDLAVRYKGKGGPKFWFSRSIARISPARKPSFQGLALVRAVRDFLDIPERKPVYRQQSLKGFS